MIDVAITLGISRAGPGFKPGPKKPELKFLGPSLARPDLRAYKLGSNPARTAKSPVRTRLKLCFMQAEPGLARRSGSKIKPEPSPMCKPGPTRTGPSGPGYPCPAVVAIPQLHLQTVVT
jgi:hypothetical protein